MVSVAARKRKKARQLAVPISKTQAAATSGDMSLYFAPGALLVVVPICYANALMNGFVFDDHGYVLRDI
jgi:hypothetical protein